MNTLLDNQSPFYSLMNQFWGGSLLWLPFVHKCGFYKSEKISNKQ